jgi:uncharacterized pyridoxal phosphate-containing UPF0001 family protein
MQASCGRHEEPWVIETIDSEKKARLLENSLVVIKRDEALMVFVQVNTSGEEGNQCGR